MARYIDADAAVEEARLAYCKDCYSYNGVICRSCPFDDVISDIEDYPEADVVPKSEVARIFEEIEKLHLHITNEFDLRRYEELKKKYTGESHADSDST